MIDLRNPTYTRRTELSSVATEGISHLLYGSDIDEDRASAIVNAVSGTAGVSTCRVEELDEARCRFHAHDADVSLFEAEEIQTFLSSLTGKIAIDLTSLENRVWAPLVRALIGLGADFIALYAEPDDYRKGDLPGNVYDLSGGRGIEPLPGFAQISRRRNDEGHFAPLLGFEGARLSHIYDQEEVEVSRSFPVIGSPGFRIEYPAITYVANQSMLELAHMHHRVELAQASCPFEAYGALQRIRERVGDHHLRVAPIGTKPHALGAILFAIANPVGTEIVYDHPRRTQGRTSGTRRVYVYEISEFLAFMGVPDAHE